MCWTRFYWGGLHWLILGGLVVGNKTSSVSLSADFFHDYQWSPFNGSVTGVSGIASCTCAENVNQWNMVENVDERDDSSYSYHFLVEMYCHANFPLEMQGKMCKSYYILKRVSLKRCRSMLLSWFYLGQKLACGEKRPAGMLAIKRSAGAAPKVNLRESTSCLPPSSANKVAHFSFETQRRHHQKSKTEVSVDPWPVSTKHLQNWQPSVPF